VTATTAKSEAEVQDSNLDFEEIQQGIEYVEAGKGFGLVKA